MSEKLRKIIIIILSLIYSLSIVIGNSFMRYNSFKLISDNIVLSIIFLILLSLSFYIIINSIFNCLNKMKKKEKKINNKLIKYFDKHPFISSLILILILWLPYIISFYPAILSPDPSFQIMQYFGIDNKYSTYVELLDKNVLITNHHPVVHTLLLGSCVKLGMTIKSVNLGLFIYGIVQILILSSVLSYTIKFMKDINTPIIYRILCLLIYALVPVFPFYSMSPVKDVIYGSLIILYIISLYKLILLKDNLKIKDIVKEILLMILVILFRNNGIYVIILSFPLLFFLGKKNLYKYILIFMVAVGFNISYNKVILPYFKISPTSVREALSIPFQQTARYTKEHDNEITKKERKKIDKILKYNTLAKRYNPEKADAVKNKYNKYATSNDLKDYFKVWYKELKKHPMTYISSTVNNTYGYFDPLKTNWYIYNRYDQNLKKAGFDYHYNNLESKRLSLTIFGLLFPYIPLVGLIVNVGFNTWILLFMIGYLLYKRKYKELIYLAPSVVTLLVCIASPVNVYFRYALPNVFAMPVMLAIFLNVVRGVKNEK